METTSTLGQRKGRAPQPWVGWGGGSVVGGGGGGSGSGVVVGGGSTIHDNDDMYMTPLGQFDLQSRSA